MIPRHFEKASDKSEINIVGEDQEGLAQVYFQQRPAGKKEVHAKQLLLLAQEIQSDEQHIQETDTPAGGPSAIGKQAYSS